jgi:LPS sulfotransferase NodH
MWGHVDDLRSRARELPGLAGADLATIVDVLLGEDVQLIHVTRPDKVEQAVSLWRAVQTQSWRSGSGPVTDCAAYVFEGVDHLRRQIEEHEAAWRRWFAERGRPVFEASYDDLAEDPRGTTAAVLEAIGLPSEQVPAPAMRRQGDDRSASWAERYRAESGSRA